MLISNLLRKKNIIQRFNKPFNDIISSTFKYPENSQSTGGLIIVNEYENMRPDVIADRIYGDGSKWDALLKYNGISNPFSIQHTDLLYGIPADELSATYKSPLFIGERDQKSESDSGPVIDPKTQKDKKRLKNLKDKAGSIVPPNINKPGDKNVKIKDGRVVFGEDVTSINKKNCPVPISRTRLQAALLKDKISI